VAESHFRWDAATTELLRRETARLIAGLAPAAFLAVLIIGREGSREPGALGPVVFLAITVSLTFYFWRVLHPRKGALRGYIANHPNGILARLRFVWFPAVVALPLWLTGLALAGYLYTAGTVAGAVVRTLYLALGLVVVRELVVRWLVLVRRRLTLKALRERRAAERAAAEQAAGEETGLQIEEPEVDLAALSEESTKLLGTGLLIGGVLGAWAIWSDILPALAIFQQVTLWTYAGTVDGVEKQIPLTLGDVGLAAILVFLTVVATRRLPALLEIVLLHRLDVGSANRFTVTTLSRYVIAMVGAILVFNALGGRWSEIQWLVAALGVGIGFGLQEIVANFISGLIILIERPLRVGDAVTVGDVEGVVSRIQIRATTITTWDRRELLVPNKEFITGRLLNWSLTDTVTRIEVQVGVDYDADIRRAMSIMAEAAQRHERVLKDPKPMVLFLSFGDNSLLLSLRCFVGSIDYRVNTVSELHNTINDRFREAGIGIAFPQRDVHLYTGQPLQVRVVRDVTGAGPA
jgi:potassium efflux system protein